MSGESSYPMHYVCTHQEAKELIDSRQRFYVSNCGCRERQEGCGQSKIDVCLSFDEASPGSGTHRRPITKEEAGELMKEARKKHLVARPFRDETDKNKIAGVCFCCQCCCDYFLNGMEACDKGTQLVSTDRNSCTNCGLCVEPCYFNARHMANDILVVVEDQCYGCGLCIEACPVECIGLKQRA